MQIMMGKYINTIDFEKYVLAENILKIIFSEKKTPDERHSLFKHIHNYNKHWLVNKICACQ